MKFVKLVNNYLEILKEALLEAPSPALILAARYLMSEFDRDIIPDWVSVLAGGMIDNWEAVLEEALAEMEVEDDDLDQT